MISTYCYCGRAFSQAEIDLVRALCADPALKTRAAISRAVCDQLGWVDGKGRPKAMSGRVALLRMAADGLIALPPPANANNANRRWPLRLEPGPEPAPLSARLADLGPLQMVTVDTKEASRAWNELIARHHYLGYSPLPGAQRRFFVRAQGQDLALLGVGAAAWACRPRDDFIGWDRPTRAARLALVVGNARFLVLPWVRVPNLASASLGLLARSLGEEWEGAYGYRPVLIETFVDATRFQGTSYRAANWIHLGRTTGRGKLDRHHAGGIPVKDVYCYPLTRDFRRHLLAPA